MLVLDLMWMGLIAWLIARAVVQYKSYEMARSTGWTSANPPPTVAVIVPARNEELNIARCLAGLVHQDYPQEKLRIIIIDDGSTDQTTAIVRRIARLDPRIELISSPPLPAGWKGKPHACWHASKACDADWLCFIDADTQPLPRLIGSAVQLSIDRHVAMLSLEPFQELGSFCERLILPAGFFLLAFSQDLRRVNDPAQPDALANGQFILISREAYDAVGGHQAVHDEICEDTALARRVKSPKRKLLVIGAEPLIHTRMYRGFSSLWEGVSKNLTEMVHGNGNAIFFGFTAIFLSLAAILLPVWSWHIALTQSTPAHYFAAVASSIGSLALLGVHIGSAVYFRIPFWFGFLFPLGYLIGSALCFNSVTRRMRGQVAWKGRIYAPPATQLRTP